MRVPGLLACVACACAACGGDDGARLRLAPTNAGPCGHPDDARTILVTPLGDFLAGRRAIEVGAAVTLADLPATTRSLAVEILGSGGELVAIGRTAPLVLDALADGDTIPIAMAPPDGMCPAGLLGQPRDRARIARVGDGVLIVGGAATASAELYDPATETAVAVMLPPGFTGPSAVVGAALAALPDGRAVLIGGPRPGFAIYEPGRGFTAATLLTEVRAHHVALALDDRRVLVAGGCGVVSDDGACEPGNARLDARIVDLITGELAFGPTLTQARLDGVGAIEVEPGPRRTALLTGGVDAAGVAVTSAERLALDGGSGATIAGAGAALARLDSGVYLTAFGPDGAPRGGGAILPLGGATAHATPTPPARGGAVLVTQDDGLVLALGGGAPLRYRPSQDDWQLLDDPGGAIAGAPAALRWDDGTVLVFGGRDGGGAPTASVWRFRPRLLGPFASALAVVPADGTADPPLTPLDPSAVDRSDGWRLGGAAPSWAIVGGPTGGLLRAELALDVPASGFVLLSSFVDPANFDRMAIVPGQGVALEEIRGGVATTRCSGGAVAPPAGVTAVQLELASTTLRVAVGGVVVLSCSQDDRVRGAVGIGSLGGAVAIESITIGR